MKLLRIGTRGSALALWQANYVKDQLAALAHGVESELVRIQTSGDRLQSASLAQIGAEAGGKGVFIKEIEDALLAGTVDIAVHSMKDVPTELPGGLVLSAIPKREDPRDCVLSRDRVALMDLRVGARVGTSSLRRQAQLRHQRPDLEVVDIRGNVDTRVRKLDAGEFDAIVLAIAGVKRLGMADRVSEILETSVMLPAVGQGALGIETRDDGAETLRLVAGLDDKETRSCVTAERSLLRELQAGCQVPLGAASGIANGVLRLEAAVFSCGGTESVRACETGAPEAAESIGIRLGHALLEKGADRILEMAGRSVGRK